MDLAGLDRRPDLGLQLECGSGHRMSAHLKPSMNRLDRFAIGMIAVGTLIVAEVASGDLFWLLVAAVAAAIYAWHKKDAELFKFACFATPVYSLGYGFAKWLLAHNHRLIDDSLARIDHGVGIAVWHWCLPHPAVRLALAVPYYTMGVAVMVAFTFSDRRRELLRAFTLSAIFGVVCYWIFPAVGPCNLGDSTAFKNTMPSLHMVFALLCWIYIRPGLRIPMSMFVLLLAAATMGLGEHYAIDLVAALPFTAAVCALARFPFARIKQRAISPSESEIGSSSNTPDAGLINPNAE